MPFWTWLMHLWLYKRHSEMLMHPELAGAILDLSGYTKSILK
jgi:hypothetical protein